MTSQNPHRAPEALRKTSTHSSSRYVFMVLLLIWLLGLMIRWTPTIISGLPFIPDGLVHVHDALYIILTGRLPGSEITPEDWRWPGLNAFISAVSLVSGLSPITVARFIIPFETSLGILLMYLIVHQISKNKLLGLIASLLYAFNSPVLLFDAGVTKQALAQPLALLFLFLFLKSRNLVGAQKVLLGATTFVCGLSLVLTHHITFLFTLTELTVLVAMNIVMEFTKPKVDKMKCLFDLGIASSFLGVTIEVVVQTNAIQSLYGRLDPYQLIFQTAAFVFLFMAPSLFLIRSRKPPGGIKFILFVGGLSLTLSAIIAPFLQLIPYFAISVVDTWLWIPALLLCETGLVGYMWQHATDLPEFSRTAMTALAIGGISLTLFSFLGGQNVLFFVLMQRTPTFLVIALIPLASVPLYLLLSKASIPKHQQKAFAVGLILLVALSGGGAFSLLFQLEPILPGGSPSRITLYSQDVWVYTWMGNHVPAEYRIGTDTETGYAVRGLANLSTNIQAAYAFIFEESSQYEAKLLFISARMLENGFQLPTVGYQWRELPENLITRLTSYSNALIYNDGANRLYAYT